MKLTFRILLAVLLATVPALAAAETWQIDPAHASAEFKVRHLMVAYVKGAFATIEGSAEINDKELSGSRVSVVIDAASIDTNNAKRDEHLRSADFLDVANYPKITFTSRKVIAEGGTLRQIVGDLTIRGTTREVTLTVDEFTPPIKDPWGLSRRGATATTEINRKDFGLTWNKLLETGGVAVGDEVKISIAVELVKK